jgi:hypothetical protein
MVKPSPIEKRKMAQGKLRQISPEKSTLPPSVKAQA